MSGNQEKVQRYTASSGPLRYQGRDSKQTFTKTSDKKSNVSFRHKFQCNPNVSSTAVNGPSLLNVRSTKINPKEKQSLHPFNSERVRKQGNSDHETKRMKSRNDPSSLMNHTRLLVNDSECRDERTKRNSPNLSLLKRTKESFSEVERRSLDHSALKPKGQGTERTLSTPRKVVTNSSPSACAKSREEERSINDGIRELELPKVTMNEVLYSWNLGTSSRTRGSNFSGKDPMEFLLTSERSASHPKHRTTTIDELRTCRYLRMDAQHGHEAHAKACSCNSCEHGQGLKSTPFLNS